MSVLSSKSEAVTDGHLLARVMYRRNRRKTLPGSGSDDRDVLTLVNRIDDVAPDVPEAEPVEREFIVRLATTTQNGPDCSVECR